MGRSPALWQTAESLGRHCEGGVELAGQVLECDKGSEFDDRLLVVVVAKAGKQCVVYSAVRDRDRFGIVECHAFALGEEGALSPVGKGEQLLFRQSPLQQRARVDVDAERTVVDLRDAHCEQRAQHRLDGRVTSVERAVEMGDAKEEAGRARPDKGGIQWLAILAPLVPEKGAQILGRALLRVRSDTHLGFSDGVVRCTGSTVKCRHSSSAARISGGRDEPQEAPVVSRVAEHADAQRYPPDANIGAQSWLRLGCQEGYLGAVRWQNGHVADVQMRQSLLGKLAIGN